MFIKASGDWSRFKDIGPMFYVDFHYIEGGNYHEKMQKVHDMVFESLKYAQDEKFEYVMFTHGYSTSGPFKTTARSVVRTIMRGKESTPYIIKSKSIQHRSVFVAAIKPKKQAKQ